MNEWVGGWVGGYRGGLGGCGECGNGLSGRTLGGGEVDDVSVFFEHVDFFDCLDGLHV